jgi:hypothetical protein
MRKDRQIHLYSKLTAVYTKDLTPSSLMKALWSGPSVSKRVRAAYKGNSDALSSPNGGCKGYSTNLMSFCRSFLFKVVFLRQPDFKMILILLTQNPIKSAADVAS